MSGQFTRILQKAGVEPWPRLFQNLRASRETELANEYPLHVVTAWLGNTPRVADKHYLQVTEEHFSQAVTAKNGGATVGAMVVQKPVPQAAAGVGTESQETPQTTMAEVVMRSVATWYEEVRMWEAPPVGLEPTFAVLGIRWIHIGLVLQMLTSQHLSGSFALHLHIIRIAFALSILPPICPPLPPAAKAAKRSRTHHIRSAPRAANFWDQSPM